MSSERSPSKQALISQYLTAPTQPPVVEIIDEDEILPLPLMPGQMELLHGTRQEAELQVDVSARALGHLAVTEEAAATAVSVRVAAAGDSAEVAIVVLDGQPAVEHGNGTQEGAQDAKPHESTGIEVIDLSEGAALGTNSGTDEEDTSAQQALESTPEYVGARMPRQSTRRRQQPPAPLDEYDEEMERLLSQSVVSKPTKPKSALSLDRILAEVAAKKEEYTFEEVNSSQESAANQSQQSEESEDEDKEKRLELLAQSRKINLGGPEPACFFVRPCSLPMPSLTGLGPFDAEQLQCMLKRGDFKRMTAVASLNLEPRDLIVWLFDMMAYDPNKVAQLAALQSLQMLFFGFEDDPMLDCGDPAGYIPYLWRPDAGVPHYPMKPSMAEFLQLFKFTDILRCYGAATGATSDQTGKEVLRAQPLQFPHGNLGLVARFLTSATLASPSCFSLEQTLVHLSLLGRILLDPIVRGSARLMPLEAALIALCASIPEDNWKQTLPRLCDSLLSTSTDPANLLELVLHSLPSSNGRTKDLQVECAWRLLQKGFEPQLDAVLAGPFNRAALLQQILHAFDVLSSMVKVTDVWPLLTAMLPLAFLSQLQPAPDFSVVHTQVLLLEFLSDEVIPSAARVQKEDLERLGSRLGTLNSSLRDCRGMNMAVSLLKNSLIEFQHKIDQFLRLAAGRITQSKLPFLLHR